MWFITLRISSDLLELNSMVIYVVVFCFGTLKETSFHSSQLNVSVRYVWPGLGFEPQEVLIMS